MLIGGLWHGASWVFVAWGGLHGLALAAERYMKQFVKLPDKRIVKILCIVLVFHFVAFCWIFFRSATFEDAYRVIMRIASLNFNPADWLTVIDSYRNVLLVIAVGYLLHFFPERPAAKARLLFEKMPPVGKAIVAGFVFWIVYATASSGTQPFIYFQF